MPKSSSRSRWLVPVVVAAAVVVVAVFTTMLPGDPATARFIQGLGIGPAPAAWITALVTRPYVYGVLTAGLMIAAWRGRLRGLVATAVLMLVWWFGGEPLKEIASRPRPTAAHVEVVRASGGYSFPSTFATAWFSAWLPVTVYAWRTRKRSGGLALAIVGGVAMLAGAWARIRMGAHWPSDLALTFALVWATFALIETGVERLDSAST